ncbi:ferredoxin [Streptomyces sp. NPDC058457]|uniref:ferredoxin n=1 Tax=Streptomyces sp. NPDC058457 TaxID=3346507 RepID=UPI003652373D
MEIHVDRERCVAAGQCALFVPGVFDQSEEDGTVVVLTPEPAPQALAAVRDAVGRCPAGAISLAPRV